MRMIETIRRRHEVRKAAPGWAAEAIALYGDQAEAAIENDAVERSGMEAYAWRLVLIEIQRARLKALEKPDNSSLARRLRHPLAPALVASEA